MKRDGKAYLYCYDGVGKIRAVLADWESDDVQFDGYDYTAYGEPLYADNSIKNPIRYAGYYYDTDTGLYYLKNRYYAANKARFLTEDPYWNVGNMLYGKFTGAVQKRVYYPAVVQSGNRYAYCGNNPMIRIDIFGLEYGYIRDFVDSIALIYGDINYEFEDDAVTITVGGGDFTKSGKFYYDGKADIPIHSGEKYNTATIAQNVDGKLYMERTDFYKAMDIRYAIYESEYTVSDSGLFADFGFNLAIGAIGMYTGLNLWESAALSTVASSIKSALSPPSGNYKSHVIVAEVYSTHLNEYYQLHTLDSLMYDGDNDGYYIETMNGVIDTVDDFGTPTSQLANIRKGILP